MRPEKAPEPSFTEIFHQMLGVRFKVLIADDSLADQFLTSRTLAASSCLELVATAGSAETVKDYLLGTGKFLQRSDYPFPDLLLLDVDMPGMSGLELLDWIRGQDFPALRIVMLSGSTDPTVAAQAILRGADYFQRKSTNSLDLTRFIRRLELVMLLLARREPAKNKSPLMNNILTVVEGRAPPWKDAILNAAKTGRNFILILDSEDELEKLWSTLGTTSVVPDRLQRWALLGLTEALTPEDFGNLQECCGERFVYLIEQITLNRNVPPRTKRYMLYCELRGIISDHETVEQAGLALLDYLEGFKMARLLPLAGIYDYGRGKWERVKKLTTN